MKPTRQELSNLFELARRAASLAAGVHRRALEDRHFRVDSKKTGLDLVTSVDQEAERELVTAIRTARPQDEIVGEEGTNVAGVSGVRWVLDPLDGTTNFVHGYPAHAVAIGVEIDGQRAIGVVHDTAGGHVYSGIAGGEASCDGRSIAVRNGDNLQQALIGTGFLPEPEVRRLQADLLRQVLPNVRDVRRSGCPSLDICAVASGALDGFYECGLGPWDISAAATIAEAAGAKVLLLDSRRLPNPFLIVANAKLASDLAALFAECGVVDGLPR